MMQISSQDLPQPFDELYDLATKQILGQLKILSQPYLIGIAGIPGSGKSTLSRILKSLCPGSLVLPMDGYHLRRSELDFEGLLRRGAPSTFDKAKFRKDLENLRRTRQGSFPEFDHAVKDPVENAIQVDSKCPLIFVEGIYVLMSDWDVERFLDMKVFLDIDLDLATDRLALRHVATGLVSTVEEGRSKAIFNDRKNSLTILADGCRERADLIVQSASV